MSLEQSESAQTVTETNMTFERQKKVDAKRQIENGIQRVANIIASNEQPLAPEPEQPPSSWKFGATETQGMEIDQVAFIN